MRNRRKSFGLPSQVAVPKKAETAAEARPYSFAKWVHEASPFDALKFHAQYQVRELLGL